MFFSHFVLAKKGPLARIWLAAHWDKKLTKAHILEINIERSVEGILQPKIKLALRTSGHLLLGVVRIYSRKAKYLLAECNEAFVKIKMAFRPGMVDLPEGNREAALATITLPEVFHDFENITDITIEVNAPTTLHQSRAEDITLKEDYGTLSLMTDDNFSFDECEMARDATNIDEGFDQSGMLMIEANKELEEDPKEQNNVSDDALNNEALLLKDIPEPETDETSASLFQSGLFEDAPISTTEQLEMADDAIKEGEEQPLMALSGGPDLTDEDTYGAPPSVGLPSPPSSPDSPLINTQVDEPPTDILSTTPSAIPEAIDDTIQLPLSDEAMEPMDEEVFALAPLETVTHKGPERTKSRRKRKLIIDEVKNISGEEMKAQLSDTRDIISTLDLAPPTKRLMHWKESGGVEKLFALPGRFLQSLNLSRLYLRHLTTRPMKEEVFETDSYPTLEDTEPKEAPKEPTRASKRLRRSDPVEPVPVATTSIEENQEEPLAEETAEPVLPNSLNINEETTTLVENPVEPEKEPLVETPVETIQPQLIEDEVAPVAEKPEEPIVEKLPEPQEEENPPIAAPVETSQPSIENSASDNLFDSLAASVTDFPPIEQPQQQQQEQSFIWDEEDEDYHNPASVGAPEEQMYDETYEQFEERVHGKRATHLMHVMKKNLDSGIKIPFSAISRGNMRKQVAQKFYTLLVLKKQQAVELEQTAPYEEIYISKGPQFDFILQ